MRQRLAVGLLCSVAFCNVAAEGPSFPRVFVKDPFTAAAVRSARDGALRRLQHPRCQALFSDFRDPAGRPLYERLLELGQTGRQYFALLPFEDGADGTPCISGRALAYTSPGHRRVRICNHAFLQVWRSQPVRAEAVLIHEALHTLGLGENPPSSGAITEQVLKRCGGP
jgi:hypothetical protein